MSQRKGRVSLVGAGPGDPELLTIRGMRALKSADVVVYDALASQDILEWAPAHAEFINVGKRGHEIPIRTQEEINNLLVSLATEGKQVVRLKGGDPYVFGRGSEEADACSGQNIPFEVVPGISAALGVPLWAGIPLTDRRYAASFTVVTAHKDPGKVRETIDWAKLANSADTLVILMGMRNLEHICRRLLDSGCPASRPSACVMNGSRPDQRVVISTLGRLVKDVRDAGLQAPAVIVIGDVVNLRENLNWAERQPLFGKRVAVTRPEADNRDWVEGFRRSGANVSTFPLLVFQAIPQTAEDSDWELSADWIALTSAEAARQLARRFPRTLRTTTVCVGMATAQTARSLGFPIFPIEGEIRDGLSLSRAFVEQQDLYGKKILFPCAEGAAETLPTNLREAGARVDRLDLYRTSRVPLSIERLVSSLMKREIDVLTFASPSAVYALSDAMSDFARESISETVCLAIGATTAEAMKDCGWSVDVIPKSPSIEGVVVALEKHFEAY